MKAIGYIRVSTEQQATEGVSLEAQKARIEAWCVANGYELEAVHVDAGISGKTMKKRPGLQKALADTRKGMVLVVYSLSRLARSTKDALTISERLNKAGADLVSLSEKVDTTTAMGKFYFTVVAAISQMERDQTSERTKMALAHKKSKNQKYSPVPFGYEDVMGQLEQVESEAQIVAEVVSRRKAGETLQAIADSLNDRGIKGKQGGKWYPYTVSYLVKRQAVNG